ncbi:hypothetical protein IW262DRAFT_1455102 [Armillaria fumosa]|nr:hypothetical protein IW262DRAFT_1455102 [Armillaria fumosa]
MSADCPKRELNALLETVHRFSAVKQEADIRTPKRHGQDGNIVHEDAGAEEPGIGEDWKLGSDEAKEEEEEEDQPPAAIPKTFVIAANAKTTFGMKRSHPAVKKGNDTYDYEQKYPEDALYEETAPAARVWRTHEDESRIHDAIMVEESRDNVDVLLVFAGLFSAVVTTFVVQTSQSLQPDYSAMSASLLYESILVQRAIANGSPVNSIAPSPLNPTIAFVPATTDVWVNGLWFTSLFLSLTTALVAVLVKQWLHHYVAIPSGTPRDRSFTRQFRYAGFQKWHVQVIIGLLPVLMHLALAMFLVGLEPLFIYTAYVVTTILPIFSPQCPYRTPLCDLVYVSVCRIVPRVTWSRYKEFLSSYRQRDFIAMFRYLPRVDARSSQSLTMVESEVVKEMSTNLAAEALHWLFAVSSNPTVQSIVIHSIGGLPMASEKKFLELRGDSEVVMKGLRDTLLGRCLLETKVSDFSYYEPAPGMELKLGRLLRFDPNGSWTHYNTFLDTTPSLYSTELIAAILSNGCTLHDRETLDQSVSPGTFLMDSTRSSKLSPRSWYHLMMVRSKDVFSRLDLDHDSNANMFPLLLYSAILKSFAKSPGGLTQGFDSPLVLSFEDALPYFLDKIYDAILSMLSKFTEDQPSVNESSSLKSLRVVVVVIRFLLHRLSLPDYEMSHTSILESLIVVNEWISEETFSSQEATVVMPVLEDIIARCVVPPLNFDSDDSYWNSRKLWYHTIIAYHSLTTAAPSACSLRGLRSTIDLMTRHWDQTAWSATCPSEHACEVLTDLLAKHVPVAFTVFREKQCLEFLGNHVFLEASVPMVSAYVAGVFAMQCGSEVDAATLQLHIGYLYNPPNLFIACCILATHRIRNIDRTAIHRDITTLVQLCPQDAAWVDCCGKFRDLVQNDDGAFFSKQHVWSSYDLEYRQMEPDEIQVEKDNISYLIQALDDLLNGGAYTMSRLDRFLVWCLGRKPKDKPEQEQKV